MKKVLVTGGGGFIGSQLIPNLAKKYNVHVVTRRERQEEKGVTYHRADLARDDLAACMDVDAIVHLASEIEINASLSAPRERIDHNLAMDLSLLEAVRKSGKKPLVIFASTDRIYGKTAKNVVQEDEPAFPIEPYTASKIMGETALELYAHLYDFPYIILRFDSVYGPGQPRTMFISDVIQKMIAGDTVTTGPLTTKKNFVYVGDVAVAIQKALIAPAKARNQAFNIGGEYGSLKSVLATLQKIFREKRKRVIRHIEEQRVFRPSKAEVSPFKLSTRKAARLLNWKATTPLYKGLLKTIEYFDV